MVLNLVLTFQNNLLKSLILMDLDDILLLLKRSVDCWPI